MSRFILITKCYNLKSQVLIFRLNVVIGLELQIYGMGSVGAEQHRKNNAHLRFIAILGSQ